MTFRYTEAKKTQMIILAHECVQDVFKFECFPDE